MTLKHGWQQQQAFARPGGEALRAWIDNCPNVDFAALTYQGGNAWRTRLLRDLGDDPRLSSLIASYDDDALASLMTNLGGHCAKTLIEAFASADDERPTLFIAYTIKGFGLPFAGHKDNHAGLMTETQIAALRTSLNIPEGEEWEPFAGLGANAEQALRALLAACPIRREKVERKSEPLPLPALTSNFAREESTQMAFGKLLNDLAKSDSALADRIVTTSPDVTVSTNLGAWVNQRGLFRRHELADLFRLEKIPSAQKWAGHQTGQHVELGIAENNLFLMLAAMGLAEPLFGTRLLPIGTVYDPFIARGLDALNYGCYQDSRFILVATPSGITLGPEGGAHQSINTPLIGMGQPGLTSFEPAFADELGTILGWAMDHLQQPNGGSAYLRLSTRKIEQIPRANEDWKAGALKGAYWMHEPRGTDAIVYMGALAPEALEAWSLLSEDYPGLGLLAVTSPGRLHAELKAAQVARRSGEAATAYVETLLAPLGRSGRLVTILDGSPTALSWLGAVHGQQVHGLGIDQFGQCGDLHDLYAAYGLDYAAIAAAARNLFGRGARRG